MADVQPPLNSWLPQGVNGSLNQREPFHNSLYQPKFNLKPSYPITIEHNTQQLPTQDNNPYPTPSRISLAPEFTDSKNNVPNSTQVQYPTSKYGRQLKPVHRYLSYTFSDEEVQAFKTSLATLLQDKSRRDKILETIYCTMRWITSWPQA
jgi:hypothetical protein